MIQTNPSKFDERTEREREGGGGGGGGASLKTETEERFSGRECVQFDVGCLHPPADAPSSSGNISRHGQTNLLATGRPIINSPESRKPSWVIDFV